jgi:hypothetical protein
LQARKTVIPALALAVGFRRRSAAVDGKRHAVYEAGVVAGEEGDPGGEHFGRREAAGGASAAICRGMSPIPSFIGCRSERGAAALTRTPRGPDSAAQAFGQQFKGGRAGAFMALFDPLA